MSEKTEISWTDSTWNPVRGCSRVSEGCRHCYAERVAARFSGPGQPYEGLAERRGAGTGLPRWTGAVRLVPEHLADPLKWRKPRRIFVNSMSDLFHEKLSNEQIAAVFGVMAAAPQHTFQCLTKRARRMREWFEWACSLPEPPVRMMNAALDALPDSTRLSVYSPSGGPDRGWPLPNVWLGVSVEDQAAADERIPELLATPAAVRFLSCEPLIGPVDLTRARRMAPDSPMPERGVDWVIAGCESGPGARPCDVAWLRSLRDQCAAASVPYFLKQATDSGADIFGCDSQGNAQGITCGFGSKRKAGGVIEAPYLDGKQHLAFPELP